MLLQVVERLLTINFKEEIKMAKKVFWKNLMSSEFDGSKLITGKFYEDAAYAEIHDGALVVIGDLDDSTVYPSVKDFNVRKITKPTALTDKVAIVDISDVTNGQIAGVTYRDGIKGTDLVSPAGKQVRVRRLAIGDTFWLASGNFASAPTVGKYATVKPNSTLFDAATEITDGQSTVKIEATSKLIEGAVNTDDKYFCTGVALA